MASTALHRLVSGGQTGVDRSALDVAITMGLDHGGWCPLGRLAEDGRIPSRYRLVETEKSDYATRTEKNVIDSDGTLVLYEQEMSGGTQLTFRLCKKHGRPVLAIDLAADVRPTEIRAWLTDNNIGILNVAGPRESNSPGVGRRAELTLLAALQSNSSHSE